MPIRIHMNAVYAPSKNIVARELQGEIIIVPITSGVGDLEGSLFSLDEMGRAVWTRLDGKRTLKDVTQNLASKYDASQKKIENDVRNFVKELVKRRLVVEVKNS